VSKEIERLSRQFNSPAHVYRSPQRPGFPGGIIATWGGIELQPLNPNDFAVEAEGKSPHRGVLVDFLINFHESARIGFPVYSLGGSKGYVWIARFDQKGKQKLRFFAADPSQMIQITQQPDYESEPSQSQPPVSYEEGKKAEWEAKKQEEEQKKTEEEGRRREAQRQNDEERAKNTIDPENAAAINIRIGDLSGQIATLTKVVGEQSEIQKNVSIAVRGSVEQTIAALNKRIEELKNEYNEKDKTFSTYLTSVRPNDRDFYLTARRASESYPKIPYYIPGTKEIGEFWIEPTVTDKGELLFGFKFVDIKSSVEKVRGKIDMSRAEIEGVQKALLKLHEWSDKAHSENVRSYEKRVICFPEKDCPPDGERIDGKSSTEIRFLVYEDGATAGRIQRNKGLFVEGYNVSIDSALMLQAYLNHVITAANREFTSGTRTKKELDDIFK
jgi:hypothetical protein